MEVRQFHSWFFVSSVASFVFAVATGWALVVKLDLALYACLASFCVKYIIEASIFTAVLVLNGDAACAQ